MNMHSQDPRKSRHRTITRLLEREPVENQSRLQRALRRAGIDVTQATLSRDLRELGVIKGPDGYRLPAAPRPSSTGYALEHAAATWLLSARQAQNLVVLRTPPGGAQPLALALDREQLADVLGTVAGDDTVFVACPSERKAKALARRLQPTDA